MKVANADRKPLQHYRWPAVMAALFMVVATLPGSWYPAAAGCFGTTGTTGTTGTSGPPAVAPVDPVGPCSQLIFTTQPGGAFVGALLSPQPIISLADAKGTIGTTGTTGSNTTGDSTSTVTVALTGAPAGVTLGGTKTVTAKQSVATFENLTVDTPGTYTLIASTSAGSFTATSTAFTVSLQTTTNSDGTKSATLTKDIGTKTTTSLGEVSLDIPSGTKITGPSDWDGTFKLPTEVATSTVSGLPTNATGIGAIEVGAGTIPLTFNRGARLGFKGHAGKRLGWSNARAGGFHEITRACAADSQAVNDALADGTDCRIDSGIDTFAWGKHATPFIVYTQIIPPFGSGGGGGFYFIPSAAATSAIAPVLTGPQPTSDTPPNTSLDDIKALAPFLMDMQVDAVRWDYLGASAVVYKIKSPILHTSSSEVDVWSGPNATGAEAANAIDFGTKPAGTDAIYFFLRGTRAYVFDVAVGNYGWFDLAP